MRERAVESYLVKKVKAAGGECLKFVSPGRRGVPDRLVLWPGGRAEFVETKAPGKKLKPEQKRFAERADELGFDVLLVDTKAKVDEYIVLFAEDIAAKKKKARA